MEWKKVELSTATVSVHVYGLLTELTKFHMHAAAWVQTVTPTLKASLTEQLEF